ncbi:hypothetical protein D3C86_1438440 [compost metagenome]
MLQGGDHPGQGLEPGLVAHQLVKVGNGLEQGVRIGVAGGFEDLIPGAHFHHLAAVHDVDGVGQVGDGGDVVADDEDGGVAQLVHLVQQPQDLGVGGGLHGAGGLVRHQQPRLVGDGHGDHHLLAHAIRQLVGIGPHHLAVILDPDSVQQGDGPLLAPLEALPELAGEGAGGDGLFQLGAYLLGGIETADGVLEDHGDLPAHDAASLLGGHGQQVHVVEAHPVGAHRPVVLLDADDHLGHQALARARFSYQAADLPLVQGQADPVHRLDLALGGVDFYGQVAYVEQGHQWCSS